MTASPRLTRALPAPEEREVTDAQLHTLVSLGRRARAHALMIGHGRTGTARENAARFSEAWERAGGQLLGSVSWPEDAASWLRQARRLTTREPDLWALAGAPAGLAQMMRRLAWSTSWQARRTLVVGGLHPQTVTAATPLVVEGLRGSHRDGAAWQITDGTVHLLIEDERRTR